MTDFERTFKSLTGHKPLSWQARLFRVHFLPGKDLSIIDLPTGLGKTMIIAIWLIAREMNKSLPRRLIYVVDRRTVVDQATDIAENLVERFADAGLSGECPAISTLRGQLADNREWSSDPSRPAIIIGTVDLIGSGLLFCGYRSSYKTRPLQAGMLGQDSLLVLDEAHLSKPFEKLVKAIEQSGSFQRDREGKSQGTPMQVIRMSATSDDSNADNVFRLDTDPNSLTYDLKSDPDPNTGEERNQIITRFNAKKCLTIKTPVDPKELCRSLAEKALELADDESLIGKRIVVFVRSPENAKAIAALISDHGKSKSNPDPKGRFADYVAVLTGTMRGLERDELVEKPTLKRFLDGNLLPSDESNQLPVFLVSTSAGEVGFDLNADHMVCDTAPLDSMIQRLGRVNRRGNGDAQVVLIPEVIKKTDKDGKPRKLTEQEKAIDNSLLLLKDQQDVSPSAVARLKANEWADRYAAACTTPPKMVELTDILLDAWSMTSITERMPGRPEVAPWLRGINEDMSQTTIAWRAELDLFKDDPNPQRPLSAIFAKHRIRPHESLTTNSYRVVAFLKEIIKKRPDLRNTRVVVKFSRGIQVTTVAELNDDSGILNADPTLILPARFGGLEKGMLNHEAIPPVAAPDEPPPKSLDVADAPGYESHEDEPTRLRILIERIEDGWKAVPLSGGVAIPEEFNLEPSYASSTSLFRALTKVGLRVRLVQPVAFDDDSNAIRSLVMLSPVVNKTNKETQTLSEHVGAVEIEAERIAKALGLKDPIRAALLFAARWHDEGKKAEIWQRFIGRPDENADFVGKAATTRDPKSLRGYRHEFGSLLRIHHTERHKTDCKLPDDQETRELALHLVATHHGNSRPHFDCPLDRDFKTKQCETIHTESIRRFAHLQRKYGWWQLAWLENLLRCADALASADEDAEDDSANDSTD